MLQDFGAKSDTALSYFLRLSDFMRANGTVLSIIAVAVIISAWMVLRRREARAAVVGAAARLPGLSTVFQFYRTTLFCRNLGVCSSTRNPRA